TIIGPAITGAHLITVWLWMVRTELEKIAHCTNHEFLCLFHGSADVHDYHQPLLYLRSGNYSFTFIYMSW
ncbi:LOW QUALITY PROTEIN: hypothetical protein CFOL_v3_15599, partial [Cephalotus follicularis]